MVLVLLKEINPLPALLLRLKVFCAATGGGVFGGAGVCPRSSSKDIMQL